MDEQTINTLIDNGPSARDNFVRLENEGITRWDSNGNSGFISMKDFNESGTSAAHEYGHGLGLTRLNFNNLEGSLKHNLSIMGAGMGILKANNIAIQSDVQKQYDVLAQLLQAIEELKKRKK